MKKTPAFLLALLLCLNVYARTGWTGEGRTVHTATQTMIKQLDGKGGMFHSCVWGILAVNLKGDTLAAHNSCRLMVPASNMKIVTTAGALLKLGASFRFNTSLRTDGEVADSTLRGNLFITGGGDPCLGNIFSYLPPEGYSFGKWKEALLAKGIRRIEGDIVGDGSYFSPEPAHSDWSTEDFDCKDGVVPTGLCWRGSARDTIPDGPFAAAFHFKEWLRRDSSITVSGRAREISPDNESSDSLFVLGDIPSAPLREIIAITNKRSDNYMAETLLRQIGLSTDSLDNYAASTASLRKALSPIRMAGRSAGMRFADGSGLSRKNYLSPEFLVGVLRGMAGSKLYSTFRNSLPKPGDAGGTLRYRLPKADSETRNRIRMKSGSMNGVLCFSGYILSPDGDSRKTIVFSIMVNNFSGKGRDLAECMDKLTESLAGENK